MSECRNCQRGKVNRPRGLCWTCYYTPGVRERFAITSKFCNYGVANGNRPSVLPGETTDALPGSEDKLAVLIERAAAAVALFHPDDAETPGERRGIQRGRFVGGD